MKRFLRNIETWFWQGVANRIIEIGTQIDDEKSFNILSFGTVFAILT